MHFVSIIPGDNPWNLACKFIRNTDFLFILCKYAAWNPDVGVKSKSHDSRSLGNSSPVQIGHVTERLSHHVSSMEILWGVCTCMCMFTHLYTVCVQSVNSFAGWERVRGEERNRTWVKECWWRPLRTKRPQLVKTSHLHLCNYVAVIYASISTLLTKALRGINKKLLSPLTLITHQLLPQMSYIQGTSVRHLWSKSHRNIS